MITFPISAMRFVSLTKPSVGPTGNVAQFSVAFPYQEVSREVAAAVPKQFNYARGSGSGLFMLRSQFPPRLYGTEPGDLNRLHEYAANHLVPVDRLLNGQPATVACELLERAQRNPSYDDMFLVLLAIRVDGNSIPLPTWEEFTA